MVRNKKSLAWLCLFLGLIVHLCVWSYARSFRAQWGGVPPVPSDFVAQSTALGDSQFAYRIYGIIFQNLGETGGRTTHFSKFDYHLLKNWFLR